MKKNLKFASKKKKPLKAASSKALKKSFLKLAFKKAELSKPLSKGNAKPFPAWCSE